MDDIQKYYNSINKINKKIDVYGFVAYIFLTVISALLARTTDIKWYWLALIDFIVSLAIIIILFFIIYGQDLKYILNKTERKKKLIDKYSLYFFKKANLRKKELNKYLKKIHVINKKDIEVVISYFEKRVPVKTKFNFMQFITTFSLNILSFIIICINQDGTTNVKQLISIGVVIIYVLIIPAIIISFLQIIHQTFFGYYSKESRESLIEDLYEAYFKTQA